MNWLADIFKVLMNFIAGPFETRQVQSPIPNEVHRYVPDNLDPDEVAYVESRKIIFRQSFHRWWIPDRDYAIYQVSGYYEGPFSERLSEKFAETITFPSIGWRSFHKTDYPHLFAIHAFLDRIVQVDPRLGLRA